MSKFTILKQLGFLEKEITTLRGDFRARGGGVPANFYFEENEDYIEELRFSSFLRNLHIYSSSKPCTIDFYCNNVLIPSMSTSFSAGRVRYIPINLELNFPLKVAIQPIGGLTWTSLKYYFEIGGRYPYYDL